MNSNYTYRLYAANNIQSMIQQKNIRTIFAYQKGFFFQANVKIENSKVKRYKKLYNKNFPKNRNASINLLIKSPEKATGKFSKLFQKGRKYL